MTEAEQREMFPIGDKALAIIASGGRLLPDSRLRERWPISLVAMLDVVTATLCYGGMARPSAARLAGEMMTALALYHGGRQHYLPKNDELLRTIRDWRMSDDFNGVNYVELAKREGLSPKQARIIIQRQRELVARGRRQMLEMRE